MLQKQEKQRVRSIRQFDETITVHSFGEWQDNLGAFG
jgi:hypothetical protein